jgi:hypothetical protein
MLIMSARNRVPDVDVVHNEVYVNKLLLNHIANNNDNVDGADGL